jgi:Asparagine synthase/Glutamine amidotransferase domain
MHITPGAINVSGVSIWDPRNGTAFVARDRFGVKPGYFALTGGKLSVASEPNAIPKLRRVDKSALCAFLVRSELYSDTRSLYDGVPILPPAHYAVFNAATGVLAVERYWAPAEAAETKPLEFEQFAELIADAVRLRMRSDVSVGLTLSGGLDSSTILTEAVKHGSRLTAFTSVYRGVAAEQEIIEERWAHLAAAPFANIELQEVGFARGGMDRNAVADCMAHGMGQPPRRRYSRCSGSWSGQEPQEFRFCSKARAQTSFSEDIFSMRARYPRCAVKGPATARSSALQRIGAGCRLLLPDAARYPPRFVGRARAICWSAARLSRAFRAARNPAARLPRRI